MSSVVLVPRCRRSSRFRLVTRPRTSSVSFLSSRIRACCSCLNVKNGSSEIVAKFASSGKDSAEKVSSSPDRVSVGRPTSFSSDRVPRWEVPSASGSGSLCPSLSYVRARGSALAGAAVSRARSCRDPFVGHSTLRAGRSKEPVVVVGNLGPGRVRGVVVLRVVRVVRRERSW